MRRGEGGRYAGDSQDFKVHTLARRLKSNKFYIKPKYVNIRQGKEFLSF